MSVAIDQASSQPTPPAFSAQITVPAGEYFATKTSFEPLFGSV